MQVTKLNSVAGSQKKSLVGGGVITAPAVAAHVRRKMAGADSRSDQHRVAERKAVTGGGVITAPAVAAHVRKTMERPVTQRKAVIGGGVITTLAVAAHVRRNTTNTRTGSN